MAANILPAGYAACETVGGTIADFLTVVRQRLPESEVQPGELEVDMSLAIGYGSTSIVYLGCLREETIVAVKDCRLRGPDADWQTVICYLRELEVWSRVNHPHILHFFGFCVADGVFRICSEHCRGGTLFDLLHNYWHIPLSWWQRRKILLDISLAVEHLHTLEKPIMHRDLKSLNVFLVGPVTDENTTPQVKLADFGFARMRRTQHRDGSTETGSTESDLTKGAGTPHWMAPEVATGTQYHEKVDVFSFSVIMYEVVCRHMAFEDLEPDAVMEEIASGGRPRLDADIVPPDTPPALLDLMVRCWDQEPSRRPSMSQAHDALLAIEWPGARHTEAGPSRT